MEEILFLPVFAGLATLGYFNNNNKVNIQEKANINSPSMDNIYNSTHMNNVYNEEKKLVEKNIKDINNIQNLNNSTDNLNTIYSSSSGTDMTKENFITNDQGIQMSPFFSRSTGSNDYSRIAGSHRGGDDYWRSRSEGITETSPFFAPQRELGNVHGFYNNYNPLTSQDRYTPGMRRTNELPFEQERVSPIDEKSNSTREIGELIANKSNIDNLRTVDNRKISYNGTVIPGKDTNDKRGSQGIVNKNQPEQTYYNSPTKWLVTTGSNLKDSNRPEHIMPTTNRQVFNKQELGIASPVDNESHEQRPSVKVSTNQQLCTDNSLNLGPHRFLGISDTTRSGYSTLPNERETTGLQEFNTNLKGDFQELQNNFQDTPKTTLKETTINSANNGYITGDFKEQTQKDHDSFKITKKQTTINSANNGYITGNYKELTSDISVPEPTIKDSTHFSHTGVAMSSSLKDMDKENYKLFETNPTKEIISQGRLPTLEGNKEWGGTNYTSGITKVELRNDKSPMGGEGGGGVERIYGSTPFEQHTNNTVTTFKEQLNNTDENPNSISNRFNPDILDPFKNNPYTKSLTSF